MGYETRFEFEIGRIDGEGPSFEQMVKDAKAWLAVEDRSIFNEKHVRRMNDAVEAYGKLTADQWEEFDYALHEQTTKFYEWREVMTRLSSAYPEFVFYVKWNGEESGDFGHAEFRKGKHREAKAVLPPLPGKWS